MPEFVAETRFDNKKNGELVFPTQLFKFGKALGISCTFSKLVRGLTNICRRGTDPNKQVGQQFEIGLFRLLNRTDTRSQGGKKTMYSSGLRQPVKRPFRGIKCWHSVYKRLPLKVDGEQVPWGGFSYAQPS